jgi:hypothetical protein
MRGSIVLVAIAGLLATSTALSGGEKKRDKERLQGTWTAVSSERGGRAASDASQHTITFRQVDHQAQ